jgi:hypothetical protein
MLALVRTYGSLELVGTSRVLVGPQSDAGELLEYAQSHLWETSGNGHWRSPLTVQFEGPLPEHLYRALGALVERWPEVEVYAYGGAEPSLAWLRHMPKLEHLSLNSYRVEGFDALADVPGLRSLGLRETLGPRPSISVLAKLPELEDLSIEGHARGFEAVAELPKLRYLSLYASRVSRLDAIAGATRLEFLSLSYGKVHDFTPLIGLPALRGLAIWQTRGMTTANLSGLAELPALEALDLGAMRTVDSLAPLRGRPASTLRYLLMEGMAGLRDYADIAELRALEEIGVWGKGPVITDVSPLLTAPNLQAIVMEPPLPEDQATRLVNRFRGRDLMVNKTWKRESAQGIRVHWRAGPSDMLHASTHVRQWVGTGQT